MLFRSGRSGVERRNGGLGGDHAGLRQGFRRVLLGVHDVDRGPELRFRRRLGGMQCSVFWKWEMGAFEWCEEEEGKGLPIIAEPRHRNVHCEIARFPPRVVELLCSGDMHDLDPSVLTRRKRTVESKWFMFPRSVRLLWERVRDTMT